MIHSQLYHYLVLPFLETQATQYFFLLSLLPEGQLILIQVAKACIPQQQEVQDVL